MLGQVTSGMDSRVLEPASSAVQHYRVGSGLIMDLTIRISEYVSYSLIVASLLIVVAFRFPKRKGE